MNRPVEDCEKIGLSGGMQYMKRATISERTGSGTCEFSSGIRKVCRIAICSLLCAVLAALCGCEKRQTVRIAVQNDTQMKIMAEMAALLLEQKGYPSEIVEVNDGLQTIHSAALGGNVDLYPAYTGEGWTEILSEKETYRPNLAGQLKEEYEDMDLQWVGISPVYSVKTLGISEEAAKKYGISTLSDLAKAAPKLVLGASSGYLEKPDGFETLKNVYGLNFKKTEVMDDQMLYDALREGIVDVIPIRSNDARLYDASIRILNDDRMALPESSAGFVATEALIEADPEIEGMLESLKDVCTARDLIVLNARVELSQETPRQAAQEFLQKKGLIPGHA